MKSKTPLVLISRPRNLIFTILLTISTVASALTPQIPENQAGSPAVLPQIPAPMPQAPANQPPMPAVDLPSTGSKFGDELQTLQKEIAILELQDKKAKLQEGINKVNKPTEKEGQGEAQSEQADIDIGIRSIYGVGHSFQAVINYRGASITVKQGSDIDGKWKVGAITSSTVRIRNGKNERVLSLSATTPTQPVQQSSALPTTPQFIPGGNSMPPMPPQFGGMPTR